MHIFGGLSSFLAQPFAGDCVHEEGIAAGFDIFCHSKKYQMLVKIVEVKLPRFFFGRILIFWGSWSRI